MPQATLIFDGAALLLAAAHDNADRELLAFSNTCCAGTHGRVQGLCKFPPAAVEPAVDGASALQVSLTHRSWAIGRMPAVPARL